jgi:hypothetical protein
MSGATGNPAENEHVSDDGPIGAEPAAARPARPD